MVKQSRAKYSGQFKVSNPSLINRISDPFRLNEKIRIHLHKKLGALAKECFSVKEFHARSF